MFNRIKAVVATAKAKMDKLDFALWVLSALFLMASSVFIVMLGVYTLSHASSLPCSGAVRFAALLFIATGCLINPIWVFLRGDFHVR